jgi:hypothetical protein
VTGTHLFSSAIVVLWLLGLPSLGWSQSGTVTQTHCRCALPSHEEAEQAWRAPEDAPCRMRTSVTVVCQLRCEGGDCAPLHVAWWASDGDGPPYRITDDDFPGRVAYMADLLQVDGTPTTPQLTRCASFVPGTIAGWPHTPLAVPLHLRNGQCTEMRGVFRVRRLEVDREEDTVTVGLQRDTGGGVHQAVVQTLQIVPRGQR